MCTNDVVQKAKEEPRWAYHSGFGDIYDTQTCTFFVRSAEIKGNANKKNATAVSWAAKQGCAKPTRGNENTAGFAAKLRKRGRLNRQEQEDETITKYRPGKLNQWLEGQGSTPTQTRKHTCWSKWDNTKSQGSTPKQARKIYVLVKSETTRNFKAKKRHLETYC